MSSVGVFQEVGNLPSQSQHVGKFQIAQSIINQAMSGCRFCQKLAGRLTQILFMKVKIISNVRGVGEKQALN